MNDNILDEFKPSSLPTKILCGLLTGLIVMIAVYNTRIGNETERLEAQRAELQMPEEKAFHPPLAAGEVADKKAAVEQILDDFKDHQLTFDYPNAESGYDLLKSLYVIQGKTPVPYNDVDNVDEFRNYYGRFTERLTDVTAFRTQTENSGTITTLTAQVAIDQENDQYGINPITHVAFNLDDENRLIGGVIYGEG